MSSPLIIFTHIPRAGGTTMWKTFRDIYGKRVKRVAGKGSPETNKTVARLLADNPHAYDIVGGHVKYGIGENCSERPFRYFTVLRDPTSIVLSRYYKHLLPHIQERKAKRRPGTFEDNLSKIRKKMSRPPEDVLMNNSNPLLNFIAAGNQMAEDRITREHLEIAKKRLAKDYICFGFVEHYPETMALVSRALGWKNIPVAEHRNTGQNRPSSHDSGLIELGREVNALDYEFYSFAKQLFNDQIMAL